MDAIAEKPPKPNKYRGLRPNLKGRPKIMVDVRELARVHTTAAVSALVAIMKDKENHPRARVAAAKEIIDRGYGPVKQQLDVTSGGEPISATALIAAIEVFTAGFAPSVAGGAAETHPLELPAVGN